MAQEGMFWKLVLEDLIVKSVKITNADWICVESSERQNGSGSGRNLDKVWTGSKTVAIERMPTGGILVDIRGRQTFLK